MSEVELKRCPFCGDEASSAGVKRWTSNPDCRWSDTNEPVLEAFYCNCLTCGGNNGGAVAGGFRTREQAIEHWNRRASDAEVQTLKDAARAIIALGEPERGIELYGEWNRRTQAWDHLRTIVGTRP